jgi:hypothetical protein
LGFVAHAGEIGAKGHAARIAQPEFARAPANLETNLDARKRGAEPNSIFSST